MPELAPYIGWTDWRALSNLDPDQARGTISDTPARGIRIVYSIDEDLGSGIHHWYVDIEVRSAAGTVLLKVRIDLPITVLDMYPFGRLWYVQNEAVTCSLPEGVKTWQNSSQQPILAYAAGEDFMGSVRFEVTLTGYMLPIPGGAVLRVVHGEVGSTNLRFRAVMTSVLTRGKTTRMLIDNTTANRHVFRLQPGGELVMATWESSEQAFDGQRAGLALSYASGNVTVGAGHIRLARKDYYTDGLSAPAPTRPCYVFLCPDGEALKLVTGTAPQSDQPAALVGQLARNGNVTALDGVLVATEVSEYNVARGADGAFIVQYDTAAQQDLMVVSRDRGVRWG